MKKFAVVLLLALPWLVHGETVTLSKDALKDKIKGAWAAQVIGVTYGFPVEFKYMSTMIPDNHRLDWHANSIADLFNSEPGAYDDIYVDLTFVNVIAEKGLDATAQDYGDAFAHAAYPLWFANQVARNNLLNGIPATESGHWQNNPAADDIDFQIESDFIGIMTPGMPNTAAAYADKVGHIMNYGDGYYGGLFVASMYSQALVQNDISAIVDAALKMVPKESLFYRIIRDVVTEYADNKTDWRQAWFAVHRKWAHLDMDPKGIQGPFNIDAKINAAWVVLALLYGEGDFAKTMDIATRAGDDADCNPATALGILGAISGYQAISPKWTNGLKAIADKPFPYTTLTLEQVYKLSYEHALANIGRNGGKVEDSQVSIAVQAPVTQPLEQSFADLKPADKHRYDPFFLADYQGGITMPDDFLYEFEGRGIVVIADAFGNEGDVIEAVIQIDDNPPKTVTAPVNYLTRRFFLNWDLTLPAGQHKMKISLNNHNSEAYLQLNSIAVYQ
ncbi:ADP-ribosylglycohydrolase family protein [Alteromonas lipolytica]|uniref:ADP-ribosylglycohydrolase family protein n=1 Tax=Alteromonas lipolytica TaxID=1856405 RepID=A0A1E8FB01_9ALTE|nr:ADP-ribosylglycohydrolase family protein [Alteromonas lipolytica]OFI33112.1 hypothetical protein BFC17_02290 [Alteromonas lipolytica]GGF62377.1 hypothetical protein GCM10011338_13490 [Alteromonas lipolytica]